MADVPLDPRGPIDPALNTPGREGLTGTAPANRYAPAVDREQITIAPNFGPPQSQPASEIKRSESGSSEERDIVRDGSLQRRPVEGPRGRLGG